MKKIQEISIIGTGLVGTCLRNYFLERGLSIKQIVTRKAKRVRVYGIQTITDIRNLEQVDLVLICVSDSAIKEVLSQIPDSQLTAYTSGALPLNHFSGRSNIAVFYPLQSFAHLNPKAIPQIPILIEAHSTDNLLTMKEFAERFFSSVIELDSEKRAQLHLAAVFVNNFSNHMIHLAQLYCRENNLPFELLLPLIKETAKKWEQHDAADLQTGPAWRGDQIAMDEHKKMLRPEWIELYDTISSSIQKHKTHIDHDKL
jgi:predicted short-subunit dehydrogenase-like oxidoreductase (DUF2520 family)